MKHFLFIFAAAFLFAQIVSAQPAQKFSTGEKLTYNLTFATFSDAGYLEFYATGREKLGEKEVNVVRAKLRTTGMVQSTLIDLNHEGTTFLAPDTNLPIRAERILREDGKTIEVGRDFTENQSVSSLNVYDLISAIYQIRRFDFAAATPNTLKIWENEKVYDARFQLAGRETITTAIGAVNAFVVQIQTADKSLNRYKLKIYISDDERRIPISFSFKLPQGEVRAEIASVQMLQPEIIVVPTPTPQASPNVKPTPRSTPTPKPYIANQPLDSNLPFALGEKLTFDVTRANQKVGTVRLEIKQRNLFNTYDSVFIAATGTGIFAATDKIESNIHPEFLVPFFQKMQLSGAFAQYNQTLTFAQEFGTVATDKGVRAEIPVGTHDVLSFVYALRAFRYRFGKDSDGKPANTRAAVFIGDAPVIVTLTPTQELIDFNNVKVKAISLRATTGNPQFDSLNVRLWLSDDSRRLPIKLTFNSPLGTVQANLVSLNAIKF